jgi:hypothetical protein
MPDNVTDLQDLIDRYVALWNQPDADARRKAIRELWTEDGAHVLLSPPQEIREAAARMAFPAPSLQMHGHEALDARVTGAYQEFIARGEFSFRAGRHAARLGNIVTFSWEMVPIGGGEPAGAGPDILVLDDDGRIQADYQLIPT